MIPPIVAIQTDYGMADGRAANIEGNILKYAHTACIYPVSNAIPHGDVMSAASMIYTVLQFMPKGSCYLSLVEKNGMHGTACAVKTKDGKYIITPDNGTLTAWMKEFGLASAVTLNLDKAPKDVDPYAYYAAVLASGLIPFSKCGKARPLDNIMLIELKSASVRPGFVKCAVFGVLRNFGNLNLNVSISDFAKAGISEGENAKVRLDRKGEPIFEATLRYDRSFGYVDLGAPILFNGSTGYMGLGLNQASFAEKYMSETLTDKYDLSEYTVTIFKVYGGKA